jgi:hypothetical protein
MYNVIIFEGLSSNDKFINHMFNREKVSLVDMVPFDAVAS